jgi:ribosomal protein S18 acetylase RimI-like enzyme
VPAIAAVQARALRSAYADLLEPEALADLDPAALEPAWDDAVRRPPSARHRVLVACSGAAVVGFAAVRPSPEPDAEADEAELAVLAVDPAHQRAGHGSRLLSAATSTVRDAGARSLVTWSPALDEARRGFLTSAGMVLDGARRTYATSDGRRVSEVRLAAALSQ